MGQEPARYSVAPALGQNTHLAIAKLDGAADDLLLTMLDDAGLAALGQQHLKLRQGVHRAVVADRLDTE